ncbi:GNAT family acetyltransferase [Marmoricola endophyticus]|uniref:GNAT family acetyltransferase n=1 Tax=Marmoricola endophyticus TaxID=2040280 RepID=A0A917F3U8_9ACTN|nr:GNAT family N-acetyltransferase [Marmoricola endophyticus]GGF50749.1 GNAT family acetyltransferase [Marmoricola endophyticus]
MLTGRLDLRPPTSYDDELAELHGIYSDPATWTHYPSARFADPERTRKLLDAWRRDWSEQGLGPWLVRLRGSERVIGNAGVSLRHNAFWNLGYRFAPELHGRGYATEACLPALGEAARVRPDLPVVAYLLEHNHASARLAERLGLDLVHRGPDAGNPDADAVRLVYADRDLDAQTLAATMR